MYGVIPKSSAHLQPFLPLWTVVHSLVNFGQVMCLNVAINSYDHALLSMLVSNQVCTGVVYAIYSTLVCGARHCAAIGSEYYPSDPRAAYCCLLQFVELKGNVFKKFGKEQINKIACYGMTTVRSLAMACIALRLFPGVLCRCRCNLTSLPHALRSQTLWSGSTR